MFWFATSRPAAAADESGAELAESSSRGLEPFSMSNISNASGYATAIVGLAIVFFALIVVTLFIMVLPRILASIATILPEEVASHDIAGVAAAKDDPGLIAAIGFVMHARRRGGPDG